MGCAAAVGAVCLFLFCHAWQSRVEPYLVLDEKEARIRSQVLDYPEERYGECYYRLRVIRVTGQEIEENPEPFTILLSSNQPFACRPYDYLECTAAFARFQEGGLYSSQNSWLANGIVLRAYLSDYEDIRVIPDSQLPWGKLFVELRHMLSRNFGKLLPGEEAGLIRAMLLGERESLSDTAYSHFKRIGSTHLLVISGLHMAAMAAFLSLLFGRLPLGRVGRNLFTAAVLLCFLAVTGFPVSALRGGVMYLLYLLAGCLGKRPDSLNSLGFAMLFLCLQDPFSGGDLSLALSAFATLGILVLYESLFRYFQKRKLWKPVAASFAVTFSATIFTLPFQILVFGGFSPLAPVANLLLVFPCTLLLYLSFAAAFLTLLPALAPFAMPFVFCAGWLARFALKAARLMAEIPGSYLSLREGGWLFIAAAVLCLGIFRSFAKERFFRRVLTGAAAVVLAVGMFQAWRSRDVVTIAAAGGEEEPAVAVIQNGEAAVLCLGGFDSGAMASMLSENNVRKVTTLFLPERGAQAREAAAEVLRSYSPQRLLLPQGAYVGKDLSREKTGLAPEFLETGGSFEALPGIGVSLELSQLSFRANGIPVAVSLDGSAPGTSGILIAGQKAARANSTFTVLRTDAIIEETSFWEDAAPGAYLCLEETDGGVYLDVDRDGKLTVRRES